MAKLVQQHRLTLGLIFIGLIIVGAVYLNNLGLDFSMLKMYRMDIEAFIMKNLALGVLIYTGIYTATIALSLPLATPLTILSGFLFGSMLGTAIVAVSATVGATLSVIINRFFFQDAVRSALGSKLKWVNAELEGHGFRDIFILRLTPIVPFSLINLGAAVTHVRVRDFFFATLVGTLPFTFIYVNAGTRIAKIDSASDIVSLPTLMGISLIVFAVSLPMFVRRSGKGQKEEVPTP